LTAQRKIMAAMAGLSMPEAGVLTSLLFHQINDFWLPGNVGSEVGY
jgi:hypothetical protein